MSRVQSLLITFVALLSLPGASWTSDTRLKRQTESEDEAKKTKPWLGSKPLLSEMDKDCFMRKGYETVWSKECTYVNDRNTAMTKPCKSFCEKWKQNLKKKFDLPDDCHFDDVNSSPWCEKKGCNGCNTPKSRMRSMCCGTCKRHC